MVGLRPDRTRDWLGVSPDALVRGQRRLVEAKCPYLEMYESVPDYYMCQVQGQLEVLDYDDCDFIVWTPEGGVIWRVIRDPSYWRWMEPKLAEFWAYVVGDVPPPRFKRGTKPVPPDASKLIVDTRYFLN